ncbi:MAG: hypothetical protein IPM31_11620 [Anaerolineae bacterium]|nr:hypothetical protein [Anaerolineae bacterium]MBL8106494.1 hypothetical protein [Anaerolineales bacterium]MCC7190595.1 hypothetical protein [Anaerolineales bacterium]
MSDWKRTTKELGFENLRPELLQAINGHIEKYNLGEILSDALMCVQTDSEKIKKGLFGGAEVVYAGAVVTPRWLVWATSGTKTQTSASSAQLNDVTIQDYAESSFANMIPDSGLNVSGRFTDASDDGLIFIGLDDNAAGAKFKEIALQTAQEAKR